MGRAQVGHGLQVIGDAAVGPGELGGTEAARHLLFNLALVQAADPAYRTRLALRAQVGVLGFRRRDPEKVRRGTPSRRTSTIKKHPAGCGWASLSGGVVPL